MRAIRAAVLAVLALPLLSGASIRALLIDGAETQSGSAAIKSILQAADIQADVVTAPAKGNPFDPPFDRYKVVILNYSSDQWPLETMAAFNRYVNNGGGLVVLAPSDAAFPAWPDYNAMLGVSGAANRDMAAGPIWFYQSENLAFDKDTPGNAGQAPQPDQPFQVTIRNTEHPVAKGLPLQWMHTSDTLAGHLRGPGKNMVVLATANSDKDRGGTGREEPVLLAVTYGKGRVFHTLLGRTPQGVSCVGFQTFLQRGAEWAATGKVTSRVPTDFPHEDKVSIRILSQ